MSLRQWAVSRGLPVSTAHKAASTGRIARRPDGRLDPDRADREWTANTRARIDSPTLRTPADREVDERMEQIVADLERPADWNGDPDDEMVSVRVVDAVEARAQAMRAAALRAMVDRIAPALVTLTTASAVRAALRRGLDEAEEAFASAWADQCQ